MDYNTVDIEICGKDAVHMQTVLDLLYVDFPSKYGINVNISAYPKVPAKPLLRDRTCRMVELDILQIDLIIDTLKQRHSDLTDLLKDSDVFEAETIRNMQIEQRDIDDVIRELQFYAITKDKELSE